MVDLRGPIFGPKQVSHDINIYYTKMCKISSSFQIRGHLDYHVYSFGVQYAEAGDSENAYLVTIISHVFTYAFGGPFFFWERKIVST